MVERSSRVQYMCMVDAHDSGEQSSWVLRINTAPQVLYVDLLRTITARLTSSPLSYVLRLR